MKKTIIVALVLVAGAAGAYILAEHRDEAKVEATVVPETLCGSNPIQPLQSPAE